MSHMIAPVELTDLELDAVAGGQAQRAVQRAAGLIVAQVAVGVEIGDIEIPVDVDIENVQVAIGVLSRIRQDQ